jgi:hypothetical protein
MSDYTRAKYWKCALQVNPASYINYRGGDHGMSEYEYNRELVLRFLPAKRRILSACFPKPQQKMN